MDIHGCSMFDSSWLQSMDLFNSSRRQVPTITDVEKSSTLGPNIYIYIMFTYIVYICIHSISYIYKYIYIV